MKKFFKNSERGIIAILTLCILLCIAGTGVYAVSVMPEETTITEDTSTVNEEALQELVPMMARGCNGDEFSTRTWDSLDAAKKYYGYDWEYKSCNYTHTNGVTYNYYYTMSSGARVYIRVL